MDRLAIVGGTPIRREPYPSWPVHDERDIEAVASVVRSGRWGGYPYPGSETKRFGERFAETQGGGHPVLMANGSVTLEVALRAADIGWGDEVIVPAYTFQATAYAPVVAGAVPVLVDVDPESYCIDPDKIEAAVTEKTKAIIVVHLGAQMADMDRIMQIAERRHLVVIEDAAHAHGAMWDGRGAGTIGDFGSFSFQSSKILTTGEGGLLLCRTAESAARAAAIINCGRPMDHHEPVSVFGVNYRMTELQAALGNVALERFLDQIAAREEAAAYFEEVIAGIPGIALLRREARITRRSFYRFVIKMDPVVVGATRDRVCAALNAEGVPCQSGWAPPMHRYDLFQPQLSRLPIPATLPERFDFQSMSFPVAEKASLRESLWLNESIFRAGRKGVEDAKDGIAKVVEHVAILDKRERPKD